MPDFPQGYKIAGQPGGNWMSELSAWKADDGYPMNPPSSYGLLPEGKDNLDSRLADQRFIDKILMLMFNDEEMKKYKKKMLKFTPETAPPPPPTPTPFTTGDPLLDEAHKIAAGG